MPDMVLSTMPLVTRSTLTKVCLLTVKPAMETVSVAGLPETSPEPYWMSTRPDPATNDEEAALEYAGVWPHATQSMLATHRSADPVSRMMSNVCEGVPMLITAR